MSRPGLPVLLTLLALAGGLWARLPQPAEEPRELRLDQRGDGQRPQKALTEGESYGQTPAELVPYHRTGAPYRGLYLTPPVFLGPGRDKPAPSNLESLRVGLLAPLEGPSANPSGVSLKQGVELALEEANASGGYRGIPFELVIRNDQALWGSSSNTLVELAYVERVWALIGSIDSNSTHVALRAAFKAELPIINVGSTDPTITETGIPWIIRVTPDDRQTGYRLASLLFEENGYSKVAVFRSTDRYGRLGIREFRDAARRLTRPIPLEILLHPGQEDFGPQLEHLADSGAEAVVVWTNARQAGQIVRQMRERGMRQAIVGTDRLVSQEFLDVAGEAAEHVEASVWLDPRRDEDELWRDFHLRYQAHFGSDPDVFAAYGYDAGRILVQVIAQEGVNRARIRDGLSSLRTYRGVTGTIRFDETSNNISPLYLARVEGGRFVFH